LPRGGLNRLDATLKSTLGKIDFFAATATDMGSIEFVRKNFFFLAAIRTFAVK
jgi:hypothetical protein